MSRHPETLIYLESETLLLVCLDSDLNAATWAFVSILCGTVLAETVSFMVAFGIIRTLRQHATSFSIRTYKMHLQLTFLLIAQVVVSFIKHIIICNVYYCYML